MTSNRSASSILSAVMALTFLVFPNHGLGSTDVHYGAPVAVGDGTARTYLAFDSTGSPVELGILMSHDAFEGLPAEPSTTGRCFDLNGNGRIDGSSECEGDYEYVLAMPSVVADRRDIPIQWVGLNWNPAGHAPPDIYDLAHFDFHFYIDSEQSVRAIRTGPCGFFIHCDDFERATLPVPARYIDHRHVNVDAAVAAMGNHLIDTTSPEFGKPPRKFTHTWIFGAYDGRITFYEPMITHEFFMSRQNVCAPIKQPDAWQIAGYHPRRYCIRYHDGARKYTVSLEGLELREAE